LYLKVKDTFYGGDLIFMGGVSGVMLVVVFNYEL